jgi:precorrin-6B methylase 2
MMYLLFDKRLHLAPISSKTKLALDVGAGTGAWTIDFGEHEVYVLILAVH